MVIGQGNRHDEISIFVLSLIYQLIKLNKNDSKKQKRLNNSKNDNKNTATHTPDTVELGNGEAKQKGTPQ